MRRVETWVGAAAAGLAAFVYALACRTGPGTRADAWLLERIEARRPRVEDLASQLAALVDPLPFAVLLIALALYALSRGRPRDALLAATVPVAAALTTQALKPLLEAPREAQTIPDASWPSGHTTAAAALAVGLVFVVPREARKLAVVVALLLTAGVGGSMVVLGFHYPSDVAGGALVALAWWGLAAGLLSSDD